MRHRAPGLKSLAADWSRPGPNTLYEHALSIATLSVLRRYMRATLHSACIAADAVEQCWQAFALSSWLLCVVQARTCRCWWAIWWPSCSARL